MPCAGWLLRRPGDGPGLHIREWIQGAISHTGLPKIKDGGEGLCRTGHGDVIENPKAVPEIWPESGVRK